jgi:hypothetical protein
MTETEKLEDVQQIIGAVFDAGMCFGDQQDRSLSRSQYLDVRKAAVAAALTAWNTLPAPALDREGVKAALQSSRGWPADLHPGPAADAILAMVGGGVPAEPTQPAYRYQDDSAVNPSMLSVSSTVEG